MDDTIRKILELDAQVDARLRAGTLKCREKLELAKEQSEALAQAQEHGTRDAIDEYEQHTREEFEEKTKALREEFDATAAKLQHLFEDRHDELLEQLFQDTLREASE